jgi:hypothetical protein
MNEEEFAKRDYLHLVENLHLQSKNGFFVCIDFIEDEFTYSNYNGENFSSITAKNMSQLDKVIADKHQNYIETIRSLLTQCLNVFYIEEKNTFYSSFTSVLNNFGNNIFPEDFIESKSIKKLNSRDDFLKIFRDNYIKSKETFSEMPFSKLSILKKCGNF